KSSITGSPIIESSMEKSLIEESLIEESIIEKNQIGKANETGENLIELETSLTNNSNYSEFDRYIDELDVQNVDIQYEFDISQDYTPSSAGLNIYEKFFCSSFIIKWES
ncbi:11187_t:CDS:2, partial [Dentiscutata erythropus]